MYSASLSIMEQHFQKPLVCVPLSPCHILREYVCPIVIENADLVPVTISFMIQLAKWPLCWIPFMKPFMVSRLENFPCRLPLLKLSCQTNPCTAVQQAKTIHFCRLRCSHFAAYVARSAPALCVQKCRTIHGLGCVNHRAWVTQPILWHICIMLFSEWNKRMKAPAFVTQYHQKAAPSEHQWRDSTAVKNIQLH